MIYDGGTYRINIEGEDSTVILDSSTNTIKANLVDINNQTAFNPINREFNVNFVGNFRGNIVISQGDKLYNWKTQQLKANIISNDGIISYNSDANEFYGKFVGTHLGDIVNQQNEIVYNADQRSLSASLRSINGDLAYDASTNTIMANFSGKIINSINVSVRNSTSTKTLVDVISETVHARVIGNVISNDGETIVNATRNSVKTKTVKTANLRPWEYDTGLTIGQNNSDLTLISGKNGIDIVKQDHSDSLSQRNRINFITDLNAALNERLLASIEGTGIHNGELYQGGVLAFGIDKDFKAKGEFSSIPSWFGVFVNDGSAPTYGIENALTQSLIFDHTGILNIPVLKLRGKQPKNPEEGTIIFNKKLKKFQGYTGDEWVNLH
mgnify:CR=1 FL=1